MSRYILDTDILTLLQREHPTVIRRIRAIDPKDIAVTVITAEEQIRGRFSGIKRAEKSKQPDRLVLAYARLWETLEDFQRLNILKFTPEAGDRYTELRGQRIRIGTQDLRIASIALSINAILVTRNQQDFSRVPELVWEDWTR